MIRFYVKNITEMEYRRGNVGSSLRSQLCIFSTINFKKSNLHRIFRAYFLYLLTKINSIFNSRITYRHHRWCILANIFEMQIFYMGEGQFYIALLHNFILYNYYRNKTKKKIKRQHPTSLPNVHHKSHKLTCPSLAATCL